MALTALAGYVLINNASGKAAIAFCSIYGLICLISTVTIHPLMKGLDAIYSKPVSFAIREIAGDHPEGKWVAIGGRWYSSFLVANGAPTVNSINHIPNYELWGELDPAGNDSYVYNRYAHIHIELAHEEESTYHLQY